MEEETKAVVEGSKLVADARAKFYADFVKAQSELPAFYKDTSGYNYKYMGLDQLLGIARPIFNKYGIGIMHECYSEVRDNYTVVSVRTVLVHKDGYAHYSTPHEMPVEQKKGLTVAQCIGSAETYARRYSLQGILGVCAEEDTDGSYGRTYGSEEPPKYNAQRSQKSAENTEALEMLVGDIKSAVANSKSVDELNMLWKTLVPPNIASETKEKLKNIFADAKKNLLNA